MTRTNKGLDALGFMADTKLAIVLRRLAEHRGPISFDTETSGLDWRYNHICGYVLAFSGDPRDSYYIPVRHRGNFNLNGWPGPDSATSWDGRISLAEKELLLRLDEPGRLVFGHNLAFDLRFLSRTGFRLKPVFEDTIINAPLIDEWQGKFGLDFCAAVAGVEAKKSAKTIEHLLSMFPHVEPKLTPKTAMSKFWELGAEDPIAVEYAEGDGTTTWQLRDWQHVELSKQDLWKVHGIESRLVPVLARMMIRGIKIDEERLAVVEDRVERDLERLYGAFWPGFSARSPADVQKWCTDQGQTGWPLTPGRKLKDGTLKRQPSFTEAWLQTHEPGRKIIEIRKLANLKSSFLGPLRADHLWNGRVHTTFNQMRGDEYGTITGRLSSSEPNLQQVPKHNEKIGRLFRSIFVPDYGTWASVDYRQCEPVLLAYYSRSKVLVDGYRANPPIDAHQAVADATGLDRQTGKRVNQTLITGGGKKVLVSRYGVDPDKIDEIWNRYFDKMPELKDLHRRASKRMSQRGYVLSLLGRRARLIDPGKAYTAVNRLLQCGNADILKLKMVELDEFLTSEADPGVEMLNNVHDAIDFQYEVENHQTFARCLEIMENFGPGSVIELDIPLLVEPGYGRNWSEATYGLNPALKD